MTCEYVGNIAYSCDIGGGGWMKWTWQEVSQYTRILQEESSLVDVQLEACLYANRCNFITEAKSWSELLWNPLALWETSVLVTKQDLRITISPFKSCISWISLYSVWRVCFCYTPSPTAVACFRAVCMCVTPPSLPLGLCSVYGAVRERSGSAGVGQGAGGAVWTADQGAGGGEEESGPPRH